MGKGFIITTVILIFAAAIAVARLSNFNVGRNQTITLPGNIEGVTYSGSTETDKNITNHFLPKVSGPPSFNTSNANKTQVNNIIDAGFLFAGDGIQNKIVTDTFISCDNSNRALVNANLTPIHNLSQTRAGMAIATVANKILFAGGYAGGTTPSSRVDIFDITTNSWFTAELSEPRGNMGTTVLGNKIFFAGGANGTITSSSRVDIYDAVSNTWTTAELSIGRYDIAAASAGNKVLFAGGIIFFGATWSVPPVDIYDISTNSWTTDTLRNRPITNLIGDAGIAATAIGNKIYFAGNASDWWAWDFGSISSTINIYDVTTNSWSISDLDMPRGYMADIAIGNKNYWAGGLYSQPNDPFTSHVEIRDMVSNSSVSACLFQPNAFFSAVLKNDRIVFFTSGVDVPVYWTLPAPVHNKFDIFNITTNTWSIGVLPANFQASSIISVNNEIYVAGGYINGILSNQVWKMNIGCLTNTSSTLTVIECKNYTLNNITYTTSGVYTQTIPNTAGCDSIITLNLTINRINTTVNISSCTAYAWNGNIYTSSGTYVDTLVATNGCDSIITLNLTINRILATVNASSCNDYSWHGKTYKTSGDYADTLISPGSCDSVITLHLTILPKSFSSVTRSICSGQTYGGHNTSGTYSDTLVAANGCDSVITLQLTVLSKPVPYLGADTSICAGGSIQLYPGAFTDYTWQDGSTQSHFTARQPGSYSVFVSNSCGSASDEIMISGKFCDIYFPAAFTPNDDGKNDGFKILGIQNFSGYRLIIYNRYGEKVFETADPAVGWTGKYKGKLQGTGVYVWQCSFMRSGFINNMNGTVILLK